VLALNRKLEEIQDNPKGRASISYRGFFCVQYDAISLQEIQLIAAVFLAVYSSASTSRNA